MSHGVAVGVICGDRYHPADLVLEGLSALDIEDISWEGITETETWSNSRLDEYVRRSSDRPRVLRPLIVLSKGNSKSVDDGAPWLTLDVQAAFDSYVKNGGALLVVHSGTVGYREEPVFRNLVGGSFAHHPAPGGVTVEWVGNGEIAAAESASFVVHDEHYLMEMHNDDVEVFLQSNSEHGRQPAGWVRRHGSGRVCVVTPGHYAEVWANAGYQAVLCRAVEWCLSDY